MAAQRTVEGRGPEEVAEDGLTARLVLGVATLASRPLPPAVSAVARARLLDALAAAISASRHPYLDAVVVVARQCGGAGTSPVPGRRERLDPGYAAMATGLAAHLGGAGDPRAEAAGRSAAASLGPAGSTAASRPAVTPAPVSPAAASMAAALSVAAARGGSGRLVLTAFALGCEVQLRVGRALSPAHHDEGWHATGTCGVLGAAVTASLLLGADPVTLGRSLGIAASQTLGQREGFATALWPFHPGKAAANGVLAALLAGRGFTASARVLEAPRGFLRVLSPAPDPAPLVDGLGERWDLLDRVVEPGPPWEEVEDRARVLVEPLMPGAADRLIRSVAAIEAAGDLDGLVEVITPAPATSSEGVS